MLGVSLCKGSKHIIVGELAEYIYYVAKITDLFIYEHPFEYDF